MKVAEDSVVSIEYTLTDDAGNVIDQSAGRGPLSYVHGRGDMVPGLERALSGRRVGDEVSVSVSPKDGYGAYDNTLMFEVPRAELPSSIQPARGMRLIVSDADGRQLPVTVLAVKSDSIIMDGNHPLACMTLHFDLRTKSARKTRPQDLSDCGSSGMCTS